MIVPNAVGNEVQKVLRPKNGIRYVMLRCCFTAVLAGTKAPTRRALRISIQLRQRFSKEICRNTLDSCLHLVHLVLLARQPSPMNRYLQDYDRISISLGSASGLRKASKSQGEMFVRVRHHHVYKRQNRRYAQFSIDKTPRLFGHHASQEGRR